MKRRHFSRAARMAACLLLACGFLPRTGFGASLQEAEQAIHQGKYVEAFRSIRELSAAGASDAARRDALIVEGRLYLALADGDKARAALDQAAALAEKLGDAAPLARALNGQARLDLLRTRYDRAEARLDRALALAEQAGDGRALVETLITRSDLQRRQGASTAAQESVQRALSVARERNDTTAAVLSIAQRAELETYQASYGAAVDSWQDAIRGFQQLGHLPALGAAVLNLGVVELELGLLRESVDRFEEALKLAREFADPVGEVRASNQLGRAYLRLKRPERARELAEAALELARRRHDYVGEAESLVQLGELWLGEPVPSLPLLPNPTVAIKYLRAAIEVYRNAGDRAGETRTLLKLGAAYVLGDQHRIAARLFETVGQAAAGSGDDDTLWQALRGEAAARQAISEGQDAALRYGEAVRVLERVYARTAGLDQELRSAFLGERRGLYEDYVGLLVGLDGAARGDPKATAFEVSELARSRQFSEMLARASAEQTLARGDPGLRALLERERAQRLELAQTLRALLGLRGAEAGEQVQQLRNRVAELAASHDQTRAQVAREFPRLAELTTPTPITVSEVQRLLAADETVLAYFVARRKLVVFVIARDQFHVEQIALSRAELRRLVDRFRGPFVNLRGAEDLRKWSPAAAADLYAKVVAPIADHLPTRGTLFIAGDDALHTLPFEALVRGSAPDTLGQAPFSDYPRLDWMGDRYQIAYLPAVGILRQLRAEKHGAGAWNKTLVAFADPDFGNDGADSNLAARGGLFGAVLSRATGSSGLPRLPETADEAHAVARAVGGNAEILLRHEASETRLYSMGRELAGARYLLFSTHGLLGGDFSGLAEPALALSLVGNPPGVDGLLTMSEVLGLRLNADVTVLSACNTAGEPENAKGGEGFAGLTRSFMFAGTRSLVVSHWPVGSRATVTLMVHFFRELAQGVPKPLALARARQQLRGIVQDGIPLAHPYFWAPFVLVGEVN